MQKIKIAVTGATGFLASRLLRQYQHAYEMIAVTRKDVNLTDEVQVGRFFADIRPDVIIHAAAMTQTAECEQDPQMAHAINVEASLYIARAAKAIGAKLIFFSTEQIYNGNPLPGPYRETDEAIPNTEYGKSKLRAETLLRQELSELWILRFSWLFGFPERGLPRGTNLLWNSLRAVARKEPIFVPVHEYRGITYVYDIIDNFMKILTIPYGTYHFGSDNQASTYETAVYILAQMGLKPAVVAEYVKPDYEKYKDQRRDVRLAYDAIKAVGIPIYSSQQGIERAIAEYRHVF